MFDRPENNIFEINNLIGRLEYFVDNETDIMDVDFCLDSIRGTLRKKPINEKDSYILSLIDKKEITKNDVEEIISFLKEIQKSKRDDK